MCLCRRKRRTAREVSEAAGSEGTLVPYPRAQQGPWERLGHNEGPGEWGGGTAIVSGEGGK